jgi:hypothetical protein
VDIAKCCAPHEFAEMHHGWWCSVATYSYRQLVRAIREVLLVVYLMTMRDRYSSLGSSDLDCMENERYGYLFNPATSHLPSLTQYTSSLTIINRLLQCGGLNLKSIRT